MADKTPVRAGVSKPQNYDPGMFSDVLSEEDFARKLGVPKETIALIPNAQVWLISEDMCASGV